MINKKRTILCRQLNRIDDMDRKKSKTNAYYPISVNLRDRKCVVVGGGNVALRKVKALLGSGAKVVVISPKPQPDIVRMFKKKAIHLIRRDYSKKDLEGASIVFACTDVKKVNHKVAEDSKARGALVNVADDPGVSDFITPSFFRRGDLTIAVSTAGRSPAFARKIRTKLEKSIGKEYGSLLSVIEEARSATKKNGVRLKGEAWQKVLDLDSLIPLLQTGQEEKAKTLLLSRLKTYCRNNKFKSRV